MSTVAEDVQMGEVVNWCKFVPLRGPIGTKHVAPDGEDYCSRHLRNMSTRETKEILKRAEEDRIRRMRVMEQQLHSISILESQQSYNAALDAQERELQKRLQEWATRPETRNSRMTSTTLQPPKSQPSPLMPSSSRSTSYPAQSRAPVPPPPKERATRVRAPPVAQAPPAQDIQALINAAVAEALRNAGVHSRSVSPCSTRSAPARFARSRYARSPPPPLSPPLSRSSSRGAVYSVPVSECVDDDQDDEDYDDDQDDDDEFVGDSDVESLTSVMSRTKI